MILKFLVSAALVIPAGLAMEPSTQVRTIVWRDSEIPTLNLLLGYSTVLQMPKEEKIVQILNGNIVFFESTPSEDRSVIALKPVNLEAKGRTTNINVYTSTGKTMTFILREVGDSTVKGDLRVVVLEDSPAGPQLFVPTSEVQKLTAQLSNMKEEIQKRDDAIADRIRTASQQELKSIRHGYELFSRKGHDFRATVYRDSQFTYIETDAQEAPAVFELKDGKPLKVDAILQDGKYVIQHLVDEGELSVGKSSVKFRYSKEG